MLFHPETSEPLELPESLPLLPIRDLVIFPFLIVPLYASRRSSIAAIEEALGGDRLLFLAAQKDMDDEIPAPGGIHTIGTVGLVMRMRKLQEGKVKILVQGLSRGQIARFVRESPSLRVQVRRIGEAPVPPLGAQHEALLRSVRENMGRLAGTGRGVAEELLPVIAGINHPGRLADLAASQLGLPVADAQLLLETENPIERLERVNEHLLRELAVQKVQKQIQLQAKEEMSRTQREYFLREQLRQIQAELGEGDGRAEELEDLRLRVLRARLPPEVETEANKQLRRLEAMNGDSAEAAVIRTWLEWICDLPWSIRTEDTLDLHRARQVLDEDHHGLQEVKERLLEYLGVRKLKQEMKGPILCLAGPPGVGKTSLGKSIARALGRSFARVSLGGIRDEAEIRGHRRTYVGAMPGRLIQALKQAGARNPVILLDEIDKMGQDFRGDPAAALLEVLDPVQNSRFRDHYLNVDFDLSEVLFIATANLLDPIPAPLRDRMEVISIAGYTEWDKLRICKRHIVPRQLEENGLDAERLRISDRAMRELIRSYTREAGLRGLERKVAAICRKVARRVAEGDERRVVIRAARLPRLLGPAPYLDDPAATVDEVGTVTGLAWTQAGGELLQIEATAMRGKGGLILTGQLGEVMKESARAALTWVRSRAEALGADPAFFEENELHIHVPAGAIPKDGPSAGVAMATALASLASGRAVRHDVAMTGEISLRGRVLAVGGLEAKLLAARRHQIREVLIPAGNERELATLPALLRRRLHIRSIRHLDELLPLALVDPAAGSPEEGGVLQVG